VKQLIRWHEFSNMNMHIHILLHTHTHTRAHHECKHHRCTDEAQINVSFVSIGGPTGLALAAESEKPVFHTLAASTPRENECMYMRVYEYIYIYQCMYAHISTHTQHTHATHTCICINCPPLHYTSRTHTCTNVHFVRVSDSTCIATAPSYASIAYCALHGGRVSSAGPKSRPVWVVVVMQCSMRGVRG
jgi:hypothetical protein